MSTKACPSPSSAILLGPLPRPQCGQGYFCDSLNISDPCSYPTFYAPTPECMLMRNSGLFCPKSGPYEPQICPPGFFCPFGEMQLPQKCPSGRFCPIGTHEPHPCPFLSVCADGSSSPMQFAPVALFALIDVCLIFTYFARRRVPWVPSRDRQVLALVSAATLLKGGRDRCCCFQVPGNAYSLTDPEKGSTPRKRHFIGTSMDRPVGTSLDDPFTQVDRPGSSGISSQKSTMISEIEAARGKKETVELMFKDLSVTIGSSVFALRECTGLVQSRRLTAIMGPSG